MLMEANANHLQLASNSLQTSSHVSGFVVVGLAVSRSQLFVLKFFLVFFWRLTGQTGTSWRWFPVEPVEFDSEVKFLAFDAN